MKDYGSQLIARTNERTGEAIQKQLNSFDSLWQDILSRSKISKQSAVDAVRQDYHARIARLKKTIVDGKELLSLQVVADPEELEDYLGALQVSCVCIFSNDVSRINCGIVFCLIA